ncbi:MAG TPA: hypothetical protein V6D17_00570 [Candidatus Obscuribacterales bacterium]
MRLLVKLVLSALAFTMVLPMIDGISFHGNFLTALLLSVFFGIMLWVVELVALALAAVLTVGSFGLALLWIIPLWILGFWILPAVALRLVADLMPAYLTIHGWGPAILGGLVMLLIGLVTSSFTSRKVRTA